MQPVSLVFPHQLFELQPCLDKNRPVYLVEEFLFFRQYRFHRQKLVLHRASMQYYAGHLKDKGYTVHYVEATDSKADIRQLISWLGRQGVRELHYTDPVDDWLEKRIRRTATAAGIKEIAYPSPNFLNLPEEAATFFDSKKSCFQTPFYIAQRKQRNLLLDAKGQPTGGKWTFDSENRKRIPKGEKIPRLPVGKENSFVKEAQTYVTKNFPDHYGKAEGFVYPVTHAEAKRWLDHFLEHRFARFGVYEDAMLRNEPFLYHSILTPALNAGLLQPGEIMEKALQAAARQDIPLNSLEGFIRQILGWREFIRLVYVREGSRQRTRNYWGFRRRIPASFWTGQTGIHPVDTVIRRTLEHGYTHHIERLMLMGNFMLLCEFNPDEVYRWFMEMYVDSYDWVMVPNVYGMSQFADGGLMTTKPYISGSNYLMKMGDWEKGPWQETWDALFWRFLHVHRNFFLSNPRLGMLVKTWDKMNPEKKERLLTTAKNYLEKLDHENGQ